MIRPIIQLGDSILRQPSDDVAPEELASPKLLSLIEDLRDTLREFQRQHNTGRGIAAPQIGVHKRVIYIETKEFSYTLINPRFVFKSAELFSVWDSCFSYWGIEFRVLRHCTVKIEYTSLSGEVLTLDASDSLAELLQHELEHLDGNLAIDQLVPPGNIRIHN